MQQDFDIVIVGCGAAAVGFLFGFLKGSEEDNLPCDICVIEQGSMGHETPTLVRDWFRTSHSQPESTSSSSSSSNPNHSLYKSVPQEGLNGRIVDIPCGVGLGGGTNINACLFSRPDFSSDFAKWPGMWKDGNILKDATILIQKAMEESNSIDKREICHEYLDTLRFFKKKRKHNEPNSFLKSKDFDSPYLTHVSGVEPFQMCTRQSNSDTGERVNYFDGLIKPILDKNQKLRSKLTFLENTKVQRIILDDNRAIGVECSKAIPGTNRQNEYFVLNVRKKVILASGSIITPALLMVSGIGNKLELDNLNIRTSVNLPPVGKNLRDHVILPRAFLTFPQLSIRKSLNSIQGWYTIREQLPSKCHSYGGNHKRDECSYQIAFTDGVISHHMIPHFVASLLHRNIISIYTMDQNSKLNKVTNCLSWFIFFILKKILTLFFVVVPVNAITATANLCLLSTKSTGSISLQQKPSSRNGPSMKNNKVTRLNDFDIHIDPKYLTDESDLEMILSGWKLMDVVKKYHFTSCFELLPGLMYGFFLRLVFNLKRFLTVNNINDKNNKVLEQHSWLTFYASEFACPFYHWVGTCAMEVDPAESSSDDEKKTYGDQNANSVVDEQLQVHKVSDLHICDASVFPTCVSAPTALTCAAMGVVLGDTIKCNMTNSYSVQDKNG